MYKRRTGSYYCDEKIIIDTEIILYFLAIDPFFNNAAIA
jgi:hypothetical protein